MKQNPEYILSKSMLVFVHKLGNYKKSRLPFYDENEMSEIAKYFDTPKLRARKEEVVFQNKLQIVLEIVKKPNSRKINDLLF
ncbi:hypothetical protein [Aureibaculum luteum]|uniref:hypothetical protein n=1 Tax=Aureibaculum luteum TaxID=1548456 RepID=UPI001300B301|nr:hypothetical protein [Aureibaculum luteum]